MKPQPITSVHNPRVKAVVKLRDQRGRRQAGLFIAEGRRAVERAAAAGLVFQEVWACPALLADNAEAGHRASAQRFAQHPDAWHGEASDIVFRKMAYVREPEGVLAVCEAPAWDIAQLQEPNSDAIDLVAVGTEKPGNLGAMVRTADAAGCRAVIASGAPADPFNPNAIRASTGAVFSLPTFSLTEADTIAHLQATGRRVLAAYPEAADAVALTEADFTGPIAVVVGPEDRGLAGHWREVAHASGGAVVRVPMAGRAVDSLNASVAAAVLLYEAVRQRQSSP